LHYLFFDCETGGLDESVHSLLTAYFAIYDENFKLIEDLDLKLKPENGKLVTVPEALKVTGIDIEEHLKDPETITYSEGKALLLKMLTKHKIKGKRKHYRPSGQNVGFDINFVKAQLTGVDDFNSMIHHRPIDTLSITTILQDIGILPKDLGNLGSLVDYFKIPMGNAHDAKEDIRMTVDVYKSITKLLIGLRDSGVSNAGNSNSLLEIIER